MNAIFIRKSIRIIKPTKLNSLNPNALSFVQRKPKFFLQKCENNEPEAFCLKFLGVGKKNPF